MCFTASSVFCNDILRLTESARILDSIETDKREIGPPQAEGGSREVFDDHVGERVGQVPLA